MARFLTSGDELPRHDIGLPRRLAAIIVEHIACYRRAALAFRSLYWDSLAMQPNHAACTRQYGRSIFIMLLSRRHSLKADEPKLTSPLADESTTTQCH